MFSFTLAMAMGRLDVDQMMEEMTLPQYMGWVAYAATGEMLMPQAYLGSMIGAMLGNKETPWELLGRPKKQQTPEQMWAVVTGSIR